uniref:General transcription factor IIH subunit 4 n=1 Tax=Corvus moneduloides TaxID=1196302 RepID=A0A8U7NIZ2_CORMO
PGIHPKTPPQRPPRVWCFPVQDFWGGGGVPKIWGGILRCEGEGSPKFGFFPKFEAFPKTWGSSHNLGGGGVPKKPRPPPKAPPVPPQARGMDLVEILSFLFQLSFSTLGKDYSVEGMSESLLTFLQHLREFGLVFQRKRKSRRFYPTRLAIALASGTAGPAGPAGPEPDGHGFVLVETNYRIYAYTDSELQVALIALFSELLYRFPNLVVAQVTRDSVQAAIANGITADQIIHFLRTRAHPVMATQTPVLPPTITDQIRLWELERDRLRFSDGVLYNQFLSQVDFEVLRDHARSLGVLVFENPGRRLMVVTPGGHPDVKRFWKRQKHNG